MKILISVIITNLICLVLIFRCSNTDTEREPNKETIVVNISKDTYDVYIGRCSEYRTHMLAKGIKPYEKGWLGNPHPIGWCDICREYHTRTECISKFRQDFYKKINSDPEFKKSILSLKGKRLGCYCKPKECHGDVIKEWIHSQAKEDTL